jgi:molybdopterin-guanine dinucleotide biosynthesis protein A
MSLSAVLLAGGESRRMGRDKATIDFRGAPLWRIQLELLQKVEPQEIFVSARTDPPWRPANVGFVADEQASCGPLSGIAAVLSRMTSDHLLVLGVDMPFMTPEYLRRLCGMVQVGRGIVPILEDRAEPLAAIYPSNADVDLATALGSGDFSLQTLLRNMIAAGKMQTIAVSPKDRPLFRNLNEPADLD